MKHLRPLFGAIIAFTLVARAYAQDPFTNGLVAYYPFNGNASDASGNGNDGTVSGASLASDRFGNPNAAYHFAGDGGHISLASSASLNITSSLTLTLWINIEP